MNVGFTYEIRDKTNTDLVYYGSSEMPSLDDRLKLHLKDFKRWKNKNTSASYYSSFKVLELNNYKATLLKIVFFTIKWQLHEQERHLIEFQTCVNERIPNRTEAEWYVTNKDKIKEKSKEYYQANRDKIKEKSNDYRKKNKEKISKKFNCPCGGKYTHYHKSIHDKSKRHQNWLCTLN